MSSAEKKTLVKKKAVKKAPTKKAAVRKTVKKAAARKTSVQSATKDNAASNKKETVQENNVVLSPVLMINDAREMHSSLSSILDKYDEVSIDASSVEMIDTALMQLLLAFAAKMKSQKKTLTWINPSQVFISRAGALNVSEGMDLMETGGA